ncbi:hypothetical protein [Fulvimarina sp. MAC3]|uniref:hypothetical protein n=1 Tax=Fulvimarina sp. MAC3 TaxID=3148887 RepID=UPI0031FD5152
MVTSRFRRRFVCLAALLWLILPLCALAEADPRVADGDTRLLIEIEAGSETPFVGEMILVTITGYYDVTIALEKFESIDLPNFTWIQLGRDNWSRGRIGGREFVTMERKLALYPQKAGIQRIGPFRHNLTLMEGKSERFKHQVVSEEIHIEIKAKPKTNGGWWLPAREVVMTDDWDMDPARMANGATATRTIRIVADGQPAEMLPNPPLMTAPWLISFIAPEKRSTEITRDGPVGTVEWTWRLRPAKSEPGEIRAFRIPWFDTTSRNMRELVIESQRVAFAAIEQQQETEDLGPNLTGIALPALLGLLVPVIAILPGRRFLSVRQIGSRIAGRVPSRDALALRLALWRGDARAYRRHAARLFSRSGADCEQLIGDLDRSLFGGSQEAGLRPDLRAIHRRLIAENAFQTR